MRKIVSLFLVVALLTLYGNLHAAKKGAQIEIQQKNGWVVKGELITVKEDSLLVLSPRGSDKSVLISEIKEIRIVKKSQALLGGGLGLVAGAAAGVVSGTSSSSSSDSSFQFFSASEAAAMSAAVFGALGFVVGAAIGGIAGTDKTIAMTDKSESDIKKTMAYLRGKARIAYSR